MANLKPIQPGQALNPSGRPKIPAEVREAAMALTPEAIKTLGDMMRDPTTPPATRITAADKILDRALGRPAQQVDITSKKEALDYSLADLLAIAYGRGIGDGATVIEGNSEPTPGGRTGGSRVRRRQRRSSVN